MVAWDIPVPAGTATRTRLQFAAHAPAPAVSGRLREAGEIPGSFQRLLQRLRAAQEEAFRGTGGMRDQGRSEAGGDSSEGRRQARGRDPGEPGEGGKHRGFAGFCAGRRKSIPGEEARSQNIPAERGLGALGAKTRGRLWNCGIRELDREEGRVLGNALRRAEAGM